jgi:hypothetical protein
MGRIRGFLAQGKRGKRLVGLIAVPTSGLVYLDANSIIYSVEKHSIYWPIIEPVWLAAKGKMIESSAATLP